MQQKCEVYELRTANSLQAQIQECMNDNWLVEYVTPIHTGTTTYVLVCYTKITY